MLPTLANGQYVLTLPPESGRPGRLQRRRYNRRPHPPGSPEEMYIKRIVALQRISGLTPEWTRIDGALIRSWAAAGSDTAGGREYARHGGNTGLTGSILSWGIIGRPAADSRRFGPIDRGCDCRAGLSWPFAAGLRRQP